MSNTKVPGSVWKPMPISEEAKERIEALEKHVAIMDEILAALVSHTT